MENLARERTDYSHRYIDKRDATDFDNLPEKIIDKIVSFLGPQSSLAAATLVPRKVNRIATPRLYTAVTLTLGRSAESFPTTIEDRQANDEMANIILEVDIPTINDCNVSAFIRSIRRRPELARHVKHLGLIPHDYGYIFRNFLGFYDQARNGPKKFRLRCQRASPSETYAAQYLRVRFTP